MSTYATQGGHSDAWVWRLRHMHSVARYQLQRPMRYGSWDHGIVLPMGWRALRWDLTCADDHLWYTCTCVSSASIVFRRVVCKIRRTSLCLHDGLRNSLCMHSLPYSAHQATFTLPKTLSAQQEHITRRHLAYLALRSLIIYAMCMITWRRWARVY